MSKTLDPANMKTMGRVRALMAEAPLAVLCTQKDEQPYGHVVAYVYSDDLRQIVFCTPEETRKVQEMRACERVALVIDNRTSHPDDAREAAAITATGVAAELTSAAQQRLWQERLIARHPYLESFVRDPGTLLFRVDLTHVLYVTQLDQVSYWVPSKAT